MTASTTTTQARTEQIRIEMDIRYLPLRSLIVARLGPAQVTEKPEHHSVGCVLLHNSVGEKYTCADRVCYPTVEIMHLTRKKPLSVLLQQAAHGHLKRTLTAKSLVAL